MDILEAYNPELDGKGNPKPNKSNRGRKAIDIDWEAFDKLCFMQSTLIDIAGWFKCSPDTIERAVKREKKMNFADYWNTQAAQGRISFRRVIVQNAQTGNLQAAMYLDSRYTKRFDSGADEDEEKDPINDETYAITFVGDEKDEDTLRLPQNTPVEFEDEDEDDY